MLLAVDIGNTSVSFGLFKGKRLARSWRLAAKKANERTLRKSLRAADVEGVCVSSVVPGLNPVLKRAIKKVCGCPTLFVTPQNAGIKILSYNKKQIGADRLVNAVAAYEIYKKPCIVIDFGTATTFDYVTGKGEYGGGVIAPGIGIINDALHENTAKLPKVRIKKTERILAQNTMQSMQSGVFHGYAGLVDHIVEGIKQEVKNKPKVIATGGFAGLIARDTRSIQELQPFLTLDGLRTIWNRNIGGLLRSARNDY